MIDFIFRATIGQLESEKQELLKELRLAESRSNQDKDDVNTDTLVTLAEVKGGFNYTFTVSYICLLQSLPYGYTILKVPVHVHINMVKPFQYLSISDRYQ